jgi:hypothetical protein
VSPLRSFNERAFTGALRSADSRLTGRADGERIPMTTGGLQMRMKLFLAAAAVAALGSLAATAGGARPAGIVFTFAGKLSATPSSGKVSIEVQGGSPPAMRAMLGHSVDQTFSYGDTTQFLQWDGGVPKVVEAGDLEAGDVVRVNVRAPRGSSLDTIEGTNATLIGDHGADPAKPGKPDYLFRGKIVSTGPSSVTITARGGNMRALRLLRGQSAEQTFTIGSSTIYLLWQGRTPTVIELADLEAGDAVAIHVRAEPRSTLAQVESTAAAKVAEHEPATASA